MKKYLKVASPQFLLSMAEGYPVVLKQFIQFCLIWPMRDYQEKHHPRSTPNRRGRGSEKAWDSLTARQMYG